MHLEDAGGMANSVDPDQTAPLSSLIWICTICLDLFIEFLLWVLILGDWHYSLDKLSSKYDSLWIYFIHFFFQALESPALFEVIDVAKGEQSYLTLEQVRDKLSTVEVVQV